LADVFAGDGSNDPAGAVGDIAGNARTVILIRDIAGDDVVHRLPSSSSRSFKNAIGKDE